jgi:TLP18.3/Psb32/MOLO-1 phosphatase superfamily protein/tetratricopeptide repeat protein
LNGRRLGPVAVLAVAFLALTGLAGWVLVHHHTGAVERPRYVFVNETDDHVHDLAFKMSLKLAEKRSGIENALVLLKRLPPGRTIEQVAVDLFGRWQIGRDRGGHGILYLYSEQENLFKIEVSYGLEALFPDAFCRQMEEAAKTYMLSEISQDFVSELLITMNLRATDGAASADQGSWRPPAWLETARSSGGGGAKTTGYRKRFEDYQAAVRLLPRSDLGGFEPATDPEDTVRRYLRSLELGLGEPQLPLLTEGSQVFRVIVPRTEAQQLRVFRFYARAMPYQLLRLDGWGLAVFRSGTPNLPIVLRRAADGRWFVDEPKAWTYFHRYEDGVDFFPKYGDLLFLPLLRRIGQPNAQNPIYQNRVRTPVPHPYPFSLAGAVAEQERAIRERSGDDRPYAVTGELYLFEVNWISRSLELFERAAAIAPDRLDYQWRLYDLYLNNSQADRALATLKGLAERLPNDRQVQDWYRFYRDSYDFKPGEFARGLTVAAQTGDEVSISRR